MLLDVVIPGRRGIDGDAGTSIVIPDPARDGLDRADDAIKFLELHERSEHQKMKRNSNKHTVVHLL